MEEENTLELNENNSGSQQTRNSETRELLTPGTGLKAHEPCLSELRQVALYFVGDAWPRSTHIVLASEVDKFVAACRELHHESAINPHSGLKTARLSRITVGRLVLFGPYWWSTPGLRDNGDPKGARVISPVADQIVFDRGADSLKPPCLE